MALIKRNICVIMLLLIMFFTGCDGSGSQGKGLMSSSGRSGELLVVCTQNQWKGIVGDSLQAIFMAPLEGLPQNEPIFSLSHVDMNDFNAIYQKQRNILYVEIDTFLTESKISHVKNKWASPQLIVSLKAPNEKNLVKSLSLYRKQIIDLFMESEMRRFQKAQYAQQDRSIDKKMQDVYKISMIVPQGFVFAVKNEEFCWLRKETKYWGQSVMIYIKNYEDTNMLSNASIIKSRNEITKKYVLGSVDSSYVQVDDFYIPTMSEYYDFKGMYAVKTQGLWKTVGDYMGGPFINYCIIDEKRNRLITIDGFLYAPTDDKRDLLRQVEAILLSFKLID